MCPLHRIDTSGTLRGTQIIRTYCLNYQSAKLDRFASNLACRRLVGDAKRCGRQNRRNRYTFSILLLAGTRQKEPGHACYPIFG